MADRHFLTTPRAVAFDEGLFEEQRPGLKWILAVNRDTAEAWQISAEKFDLKRFRMDRRFGPQWACELRQWTQLTGPGGTPMPVQASLWEAA